MDAASTTAAAQVFPPPARTASSTPPTAIHSPTFHDVLSSLNPLQHIPVIGTIYRAVTGDEIPEAARNLGSLAVSGLMGGPIGLAGNLAFLAVRKLTGIDPERIGQDLLADIGIGHHAGGPTPLSAAEPRSQSVTTEASAEPRPTAWSASQLKAYGITTDTDGTLRNGDLSGCDVLNSLMLADLQPPNHAQASA